MAKPVRLRLGPPRRSSGWQVTSNGNGFRAVGAIAPLEHTLPRHVHADAGDKPPKEVSSSAMSENAPSSRYISTADIGEAVVALGAEVARPGRLFAIEVRRREASRFPDVWLGDNGERVAAADDAN
jgi:hypothetical protein